MPGQVQLLQQFCANKTTLPVAGSVGRLTAAPLLPAFCVARAPAPIRGTERGTAPTGARLPRSLHSPARRHLTSLHASPEPAAPLQPVRRLACAPRATPPSRTATSRPAWRRPAALAATDRHQQRGQAWPSHRHSREGITASSSTEAAAQPRDDGRRRDPIFTGPCPTPRATRSRLWIGFRHEPGAREARSATRRCLSLCLVLAAIDRRRPSAD